QIRVPAIRAVRGRAWMAQSATVIQRAMTTATTMKMMTTRTTIKWPFHAPKDCWRYRSRRCCGVSVVAVGSALVCASHGRGACPCCGAGGFPVPAYLGLASPPHCRGETALGAPPGFLRSTFYHQHRGQYGARFSAFGCFGRVGAVLGTSGRFCDGVE